MERPATKPLISKPPEAHNGSYAETDDKDTQAHGNKVSQGCVKTPFAFFVKKKNIIRRAEKIVPDPMECNNDTARHDMLYKGLDPGHIKGLPGP